MPQSAEEIYALARSRTDEPDLGFVAWPAFPWAAEGGRLVAKELDPPAELDRVRNGEGGVDCWRCDHPDDDVVWGNERWVLSTDREGRGGMLVLPPVPEDVWQREVGQVAAVMAAGEDA